MANNLADTLKKTKAELTAAFEKEKQTIMHIDEQIAGLQTARQEHVQEMARLQGEHRLAEKLLAENQ